MSIEYAGVQMKHKSGYVMKLDRCLQYQESARYAASPSKLPLHVFGYAPSAGAKCLNAITVA